MNKYTGKFLMRIAAIAVSVALACPYAYASDVGKVTYVEGRVDVTRQGSETATLLKSGDSISIGDAVRTKSNSKAEITFDDKSALRIAQNSRIEVKDYVLDSDNKRKTANIMLDRGKARAIIAKMSDKAEFCISTPNALGTVKGSDVFASYQAGSSSMLVAEGRLSIINLLNPQEALVIPAGSSVVVPSEGTPQGPRVYLDLEKKLQEQATAIPVTVSRSANAAVIKGVFTKMSGDVRVTSKGSDKSRKATINETLGEGDTIETGSDGIAEISFDNGNGLNLKGNTKITIITLVQDPKTGQYENRFEAAMGKVRARIEKLKETNSTFEVRTPTAVCGARGTLMYIEITSGGARVFFEGGNGYMNSLISSLQSTIDAGQSAYSDGSGNISAPTTLSSQERESWGSGWDAGNGTEGYSSSGGTVGVYLGGNTGGTIGGTRIVGSTNTGTGNNNPFVNIPFVPQTSTGGTTQETPEELDFDASFNLTGDIFYYGEPNGVIDGSEGGLVGSFWNEEQMAELISAGNFDLTDVDGRPFVWTSTEGVLHNTVPETGSFVTETGGAFYGIAGGIGGGDATGGMLEGLSRFIYIDPNGNVGIGGGNLIGTYSNTSGAYILLSTLDGLIGELMPDDDNIGVTAEGMADAIWTNSDNDEGGSEDDSNGLLTISLVNGETFVAQNWGIYGGRGTGEFQSTPEDGVAFDVSGRNSFGAYYDNDQEEFNYDMGYWSASITSASVANNKLSGSFLGRFLTYTKMGTISGDMLGTYRNDLLWQGVSAGQWYGDPLTFSGTWGQDIRSLYYNDGGNIEYAGDDTGLIGAVTSPWKNLAEFLAAGEYSIDSETPESDALIWNTPIESYDITTDNYTTIDGGYFYGFTAGVWYNEIVNGSAVTIYVDPDGIAGYLLSSFLDGFYYPDSDIWMADGVFESTQVVGGFDPEDVEISSEDLYTNYLEGDIFNGDNYLEGQSDSGSTHFISEESWGIFSLNLGDDNYYDGGDDPRMWTAEIDGYGGFGYYDSMGLMGGNLYGVSDTSDDGGWVATVIGTWGARDYYGGEPYDDDGIFYGYLGGIWDDGIITGKMVGIYAQPDDYDPVGTELWMVEGAGSFYDEALDVNIDYAAGMTLEFPNSNWGIWSINFGGSYSDAPERNMSIFKLEIVGYSEFNDNGYGGYWVAFGSGLLDAWSGRVTGAVRGMTISDGEVGMIYGDLMGITIEDMYWDAVALGYYQAMGSTEYGDSYGEGDFLEMLEFGSFSAEGLGSFSNGKSIDVTYFDAMTMNFYGQYWGVWEANLGGTCDTDISSIFKIAFAGTTESSGEGSDAYIIGTLAGTANDSVLKGNFRGIWLESLDDETLRAGAISGVSDGYIDVDETSGTWNAAAVGEWVEVTDLLEFDKIGMNVEQLNNFVTIPITEVYSNILTGINGGMSATANMTLYQNQFANIWTMLINGTYSDTPDAGWSLDLGSGGDAVNLQNGTWSEEGTWSADVTGTVGGNDITSGQAGGTYDGGAFTGVGAGTWETPSQETPA